MLCVCACLHSGVCDRLHTCPLITGQQTTDTTGCQCPDEKGKVSPCTKSWAGPLQNLGVKIKLSEGQCKVGDQVNLTERPH